MTINVQVPVVDDQLPGRRPVAPSACTSRAGSSTWTAPQALRYARSRHTSTDFDRGARQQRVLLSLREQADPQTLIPRLPELVDALKKAVRTDIPIDQLDELLGLASQVDTANIRSYVFAPPLYSARHLPGARGYMIIPNIARIKQRGEERLHRGSAPTRPSARPWPRKGRASGSSTARATQNRGAQLAGYLEYHGLAASAPRGKPEGAVPAKTVITIYNGAETDLTATIAYLEATFEVTVKTASDPAIAADVMVTIGRTTPELRSRRRQS